MKQPQLVDATQGELDELLALAKTSFPQQQYDLLERVLITFVYVMQALQNAKTSLKRFRQILFGNSTETKRNVLQGLLDAIDLKKEQASMEPASHDSAARQAQVGDSTQEKPSKGHGRNGVTSYGGADIVECNHADLQPGDRCPQCLDGKLYLSEPKILVKVNGQLPLGATIYKLQRWRCRFCEATFTAPLPEDVDARKYDASCASMIALLRYGSGMPFHRLEGLQACLQVPLPDATQWEIVDQAATGPRHVFGELIRQAAQAEVLHNDDTPGRILALMGERRAKAQAAGSVLPKTKAINTSGIVALLGAQKVMLFFTGAAHAGANLAQVCHMAQQR